jgi:Epoxide hydrolase N terminus
MNTRTSVTTDEGIRAMKIDVPESELVKLLRRVMATCLSVEETATDQFQGVRLEKIPQRVRYSGTEYDWRQGAAKLNALPEFVTEIDGLPIRFVHVRSHHSRALPLIMSRGWPGSVLELLKFIGQLTKIPRATAGGPRTPSMSSFLRCRETARRFSQRQHAGVPIARRVPAMN